MNVIYDYILLQRQSYIRPKLWFVKQSFTYIRRRIFSILTTIYPNKPDVIYVCFNVPYLTFHRSAVECYLFTLITAKLMRSDCNNSRSHENQHTPTITICSVAIKTIVARTRGSLCVVIHVTRCTFMTIGCFTQI